MSLNGIVANAGFLSPEITEDPQLPNHVNYAPSAAHPLSFEKAPRLRPLYSHCCEPEAAQYRIPEAAENDGALPTLSTGSELVDLVSRTQPEEPIVSPHPARDEASLHCISDTSKFSRPSVLRRFSLISQSLTSLIAANVMQGQNFEDNEVVVVQPEMFQKRAYKFINHLMQPCIVQSNGRFRLVCDFIHFIAIIATLLFTPFQVLFKLDAFQGDSSYHIFYIIADVLFGISMMINCVSSRRHRGIEVTQPVQLFILYSKNHLAMDAILLLPYDVLTATPFSALFRLLRIAYIFGYFTSWLRFTSINQIILRLFRLIIVLTVLVHWLSCAFSFVLISDSDDSAHDSPKYGHWLPEIDVDELITNHGYRYLVGCFWGFNGVMGHMSTYPHTNAQITLTFCMNVIGLIAHSLFFSSVASMVHHMIADTSAFTELISCVNEDMQSLKLPLEMQTRIRNYFVYHNERFSQKKESSLMNRLPPYLQMELSIHLNSEIITNVPFFAHADQSFALQLSKVMTLQVCLPGEYIIRHGDIGTEMYFLTSGSVEVTTGATVHKVLTSGQFFGEMALIEKSRRTANVRAVTYCDFLVLCKRDLDSILEDCPEIKRSMVTIVHNRKVSNKFHAKNQTYSVGNLVSEHMAIKKAKDSIRATRAAEVDHELAATTLSDQHASAHETAEILTFNVPTKSFAELSAGDHVLEILRPNDPSQEAQLRSTPALNASNIRTISGRRILRPLPVEKPNN